MIIVSNINIAVAIKRGGRPTRLLPHAKMLLVPRKFFFPLFLPGRLCKSIHKIHNLSCITIWLVLLVCWLGFFFLFVFFFCVKLQEVVIILNIARRGTSFIK